jgi:hypothetical protein
MEVKTPAEIGLSTIYKNFKDFSKLAFFCEESADDKSDNTTCYVLRSKQCVQSLAPGTKATGLCVSCGPLTKSVWSLQRQAAKKVEIHGGMTVTTSVVAKLSREQLVSVVAAVRKRKDRLIQNEKRKVERLRALLEKDSHALKSGDVSNVQTLLAAVQPFIDEKFGKGSDHAILWAEFMKLLVRDGAAPRYSDPIMQMAMSLVPRTSKSVFDNIQKLFLLPTRRHAQNKRDDQLSGGAKMEDGPRVTTCRRFKEHAKIAGLVGDALDVIVSFDGMVMRDSATLSNKKETKNKLIGVHLIESDPVIEHLFDQHVKKVSAAIKDERTFEERMSAALIPNREHLVYYAKSMKPGVDLCFICAAYNLGTVQAHHIAHQAWDTILVLAHNDFVVRVLTADGAQSNVSYFLSKCKKKASDFIPAHILQKHNLDGDFPVAFEHPVTGTPIFYIADPPHALKKVGSSLEHRVLQYDGIPMSKEMLFSVYEAMNVHSGEGSLMANLKLKDGDFKGNQWNAMNVGRVARVLSGTMVKMIDEVCNNPERYPMPETCPAGIDRVALFSKVRQLCRHMNRWFDICNIVHARELLRSSTLELISSPRRVALSFQMSSYNRLLNNSPENSKSAWKY